MKSIYAWDVWTYLKNGDTVYAVETDGTAPNTVNLSAVTVLQAAKLINRHETDNHCSYFVVEQGVEE